MQLPSEASLQGDARHNLVVFTLAIIASAHRHENPQRLNRVKDTADDL